MRKTVIALILFFALAMQSCSLFIVNTNKKSSDIAAAIIDAGSPCHTVYAGYGYSTDTLNEGVMKRLYGFSDVRKKCLDYTVCISNGNTLWEIHIYRTLSLYDNDEVIKLFMRRLEMLDSAETGEFSKISLERVKNAYVFTRKNVVCMLVTEDNEKYKKRILSEIND